jgi:hypothetical protein
VLLLARAAFPAWRSASVAGSWLGTAELAEAGTRSSVAAAAARAPLPVSAATGVRLALEPGHGRTAVPVRSTLAASIVAIASVVAAATFGANLQRLVRTPLLWGRGWDVTFDGHAGPVLHEPTVARLRDHPDVAALAAGVRADVKVDGRTVPSIGLENVKGHLSATMVAGRAPAADDEIALGTTVLRRIHRSVGDHVDVQVGEEHHRMRISGRAVLPALGSFLHEPTGLGTGAVLTPSVLVRGDPEFGEEEPYGFFAVRVHEGHGTEGVRRAVRAGPTLCPVGCYFRTARPTEVSNYQRVASMPVALAGVLLLLAVATLAHTLLTSIRRRRRDLAVLKTMGFARRQVSAAVAWQASTIAALAVLVGVPLGVAAGRWAWSLFAGRLGVATDAVTPIGPVVLALPAAVLLANLMAALPARAASKVRPALVLRTE